MSTPTRPPAAPDWARVGGADSKPTQVEREEAGQAGVPQRRAETAITDAAKSTMSALQVALGRPKAAPPPVTERKDERDAERRKAKRRRRAIVWGRRAGYVLLAAGAVWLVLLSPVFALDPAKVEVTGYGTVVDPQAVHAVVKGHEGESLAMLSVSHMGSALQDIPGVRSAHVERHWPDGLVVTLVSREPVAAVPDPKGGYNLVDDEGVQVGRASKPPKDLPTMTVPLDDAKVLASALGVLAALPDELKNRVTSISASTEDSVSFKLSKGPRIEWGSAEDSKLKAQVLEVLLDSKRASKADVIDVSAPTLPITKNN
jgi:cell division protein FtsQ